MKCVCGSNVTITYANFSLIEGQAIITCNNCKRVYSESDFSDNEIEVTYWKTQLKSEE